MTRAAHAVAARPRAAAAPLLAAAALLVAAAPAARAEVGTPPATRGVGVEERLGARLPTDLVFTGHDGRRLRLGALLGGGRPLLLVPAYYRCPTLCGLVLDGVARAAAGLGWPLGERWRAVTVSLDPRERPVDAARRRAAVTAGLAGARAPGAWPFLVGDPAAVRALTDRLGYRFRYDPASDQFAHPAAVVLLTPDGRVARYLYGVAFPPRELRLGLLEASRGRIGGVFDRVLMTCYRYDPATRRYGAFVLGFMRLGALAILAAAATLLALLWRRERNRAREERA